MGVTLQRTRSVQRSLLPGWLVAAVDRGLPTVFTRPNRIDVLLWCRRGGVGMDPRFLRPESHQQTAEQAPSTVTTLACPNASGLAACRYIPPWHPPQRPDGAAGGERTTAAVDPSEPSRTRNQAAPRLPSRIQIAAQPHDATTTGRPAGQPSDPRATFRAGLCPVGLVVTVGECGASQAER